MSRVAHGAPFGSPAGLLRLDTVLGGPHTSQMARAFRKIAEYRDVDAAIFRDEIMARGEPAVLRGAVSHWSAVAEGKRSPRALCDYLKTFDAGAPVQTLVSTPETGGRFFYRDGMKGVNFKCGAHPFGAVLTQLLAQIDAPGAPYISIQSAPVFHHLPRFAEANALALAPEGVEPRIWIGNAVTVHTHYDPFENIACVVAGRRRMTLFPPDQISNLYPGPIDNRPFDAPVSMPSPVAPDFDRYPRFREALAEAQQADVEPGDAVYIPYLWWHHVQSLAPFNALVNYWWGGEDAKNGSPFMALFHAMLSVRELPPAQREAWRALFDYYIFQADPDPAAHLPAGQQGVLGPKTPPLAANIRAAVRKSLED